MAGLPSLPGSAGTSFEISVVGVAGVASCWSALSQLVKIHTDAKMAIKNNCFIVIEFFPGRHGREVFVFPALPPESDFLKQTVRLVNHRLRLWPLPHTCRGRPKAATLYRDAGVRTGHRAGCGRQSRKQQGCGHTCGCPVTGRHSAGAIKSAVGILQDCGFNHSFDGFC
jgi:hypothetical protein